jgi:gluconolactonase
MKKDRLEAFSDGVIAIIITIMVLEIHVPHGDQLKDLSSMVPVLITYVLSFVYIGIYWTNHHHMLYTVERVNGSILWANLYLLFWLSLVPFATAWMGQNHLSRWPVVLYGGVLLMCGSGYSILQWSLVKEAGRESPLALAVGRDWKGNLSLAIYVVAIALAFIDPLLSLGLYVIVALIWFIPDRRIEKKVMTIIFIACSIPFAAYSQKKVGKVEIYDNRTAALIDSNAKIEVLGSHYQWSEGPVWIARKNMLLFSDVLANTIYRWKAGDTPRVWLHPSGYTETAPRNGENGSNGLTLDRNGHLLLCQSGNRQVVRLNAPLDSPRPVFTVLAANYQGKRFNSPNDLVVDSHNNIYFTDPIYGLPGKEKDPTRELSFEGVYRISSAGQLTLLIDSIARPNGIALSRDEKTLYVGSSDDPHTRWYAYQLDNKGKITGGGMLMDGTALKARATVKQGADGFKIDQQGNIWSAGPDGVNIISPEGRLLGLIRIYDRRVSNCAFNQEKNFLYITATDLLLRVRLK